MATIKRVVYKPSGRSHDWLKSIGLFVCTLALIVFLIANFYLAPIEKQTAIMFIGDIIAFYIYFFSIRLIEAKYLRNFTRFFIGLSLFVILAIVSLRIVYYVKLDKVSYDIPESGTIKVSVSYKEKYYLDSFSWSTDSAHTDVWVNGASNIATITLGEETKITISGKVVNEGNEETKMHVITKESFKNGQCVFEREISFGHFTGKINIYLKPYLSFWDIVLS